MPSKQRTIRRGPEEALEDVASSSVACGIMREDELEQKPMLVVCLIGNTRSHGDEEEKQFPPFSIYEGICSSRISYHANDLDHR